MKSVRLRSYKDTGTILVDDGLIDRDRLREAAQVQEETGYCLGRTLVELGFISEWELAKAVAKELGVPFVRLKNGDGIAESVRALDPHILHQNLFFILDRFEGVDTIVIAEPPGLDLITNLSGQLGDRVFFLVALISDVVRVLEQTAPLGELVFAEDEASRSAEEILRGFD